MPDFSNINRPKNATGVIVFANGTIIWGTGFGAETTNVGEICFNTSLTGYQEVMTDPSYAGQIVNFTFPHIGNVGTNDEDNECLEPAARGMIVREDLTLPSNWRAQQNLDAWLKEKNLPGISNIDTRALTRHIRDNGAPNGVIAYNAAGEFDLDALYSQAKQFPGLDGLDLAKDVTCTKPYDWNESLWSLKGGYGTQDAPIKKVVAVDFGAKRNILRCLANAGCDVTVVPAQTSAEDILAMKPDGVFLSNGPGDPSATGAYAVPMIKAIIEAGIPLFGICLGHQLLALALGGKTRKMHLGHRGGNHPVKDLETSKVEITSQNHGFEVIEDSLPAGVKATHVSLFDGSNEGLRLEGKPVFSVQYHPEASPGPEDSYYLFERFVEEMKKAA
ncbi:MAG: carbamoyl phosphate synthase small subunit [Alphaproteobacteria bacterium]|nr:carbamoyl phosphate synthase small subunit [Alphaproteobacteria bacterium]HCQ71370.1 carbamoyl phosphate synthase small subunit [Rhodospirillaceae bacterium]|tara:strand:+ start:14401 stop:15567 length:1167 start_codon:yes stop_codon:yes gene_type:complete